MFVRKELMSRCCREPSNESCHLGLLPGRSWGKAQGAHHIQVHGSMEEAGLCFSLNRLPTTPIFQQGWVSEGRGMQSAERGHSA